MKKKVEKKNVPAIDNKELIIAMEELEKLEESRRHTNHKLSRPRGVASNEMCTFLIINISSIQLIPINIIAYRSQYGSVHPASIVGAAIIATTVNTLVSVIYCRLRDN